MSKMKNHSHKIIGKIINDMKSLKDFGRFCIFLIKNLFSIVKNSEANFKQQQQ